MATGQRSGHGQGDVDFIDERVAELFAANTTQKAVFAFVAKHAPAKVPVAP